MEIDAPVALVSHALADFFTQLGDFADTLVRVEGTLAAEPDTPVHTKCPVAGGDRRGGALFDRQVLGADAGRDVTVYVTSHRAGEQLVQGRAQGLAFDIPQRHIEGALRVDLFAAGRIEPLHVHRLPEALDLERVLADQASGALLERVLGAAFADSCNSGVGLDGTDHIALVEKLIPVWRLIDADARDLRRSERGLRAVEGRQRGGRRGLQKLASIHAYILPVK